MGKCVKTNMGSIPLEDYLEIRAQQLGFSSYEELREEGYIIDVPEAEEEEVMKKRIRSGYVDMYEGQTTDEDIQNGFQLIEKEKSIVAKIMEEMVSDGDDESDKLLNLYLESTPKERALLDCALIALCGWSLHTIIDMLTKPED